MSRTGTRSSRSDSGDRHRRRGGTGVRGEPTVGATEPAEELIYGKNAVREALRGRRVVSAIILSAGRSGEATEVSEQKVAEWCKDSGCAVPRISRLPGKEMATRLQTVDHQGVAAEVGPYPYVDEDGLLSRFSLLVALDSVQDPQNLGAVIRSAEACGAGVVIPRHRAAPVTPAVVKASAGATEHASVARVRNLSDFLDAAKKRDFWVYGADAEADSDYTEQDYTRPTCFVMGSEGRGLGRKVSSFCDFVISLPLRGRVGSLNVSVSTGVLLYEALRQREPAQTGSAG